MKALNRILVSWWMKSNADGKGMECNKVGLREQPAAQ